MWFESSENYYLLRLWIHESVNKNTGLPRTDTLLWLLKDLSITLMHQLVTSNVGDCWCSFTCYNFPVDNQNCLGVGKISGPFFYTLFFKFLFYWNSVDSAWHQGLSLCSNHSDLWMFHIIVLKNYAAVSRF